MEELGIFNQLLISKVSSCKVIIGRSLWHHSLFIILNIYEYITALVYPDMLMIFSCQKGGQRHAG